MRFCLVDQLGTLNLSLVKPNFLLYAQSKSKQLSDTNDATWKQPEITEMNAILPEWLLKNEFPHSS